MPDNTLARIAALRSRMRRPYAHAGARQRSRVLLRVEVFLPPLAAAVWRLQQSDGEIPWA